MTIGIVCDCLLTLPLRIRDMLASRVAVFVEAGYISDRRSGHEAYTVMSEKPLVSEKICALRPLFSVAGPQES